MDVAHYNSRLVIVLCSLAAGLLADLIAANDEQLETCLDQ